MIVRVKMVAQLYIDGLGRRLTQDNYYLVTADEAESLIRQGAAELDSVPAQVDHEDADDPALHAMRSRLEELARDREAELAAAAAAKKRDAFAANPGARPQPHPGTKES